MTSKPVAEKQNKKISYDIKFKLDVLPCVKIMIIEQMLGISDQYEASSG